MSDAADDGLPMMIWRSAVFPRGDGVQVQSEKVPTMEYCVCPDGDGGFEAWFGSECLHAGSMADCINACREREASFIEVPISPWPKPTPIHIGQLIQLDQVGGVIGLLKRFEWNRAGAADDWTVTLTLDWTHWEIKVTDGQT